MRPLIRHVPLLEEVLAIHAPVIGADLPGYRGHCYRVLNFCAAFGPDTADAARKLAIATAFHDIAIWTHQTFDYLEPSLRLAIEHLEQTGRGQWHDEIAQAIRQHHRIRGCPAAAGPLAEAFRRADWIDVTHGLLTFGLPRRLIREAYATWPSAGFHRKLLHLTWQRWQSHPLSPLPMLKL